MNYITFQGIHVTAPEKWDAEGLQIFGDNFVSFANRLACCKKTKPFYKLEGAVRSLLKARSRYQELFT